MLSMPDSYTSHVLLQATHVVHPEAEKPEVVLVSLVLRKRRCAFFQDGEQLRLVAAAGIGLASPFDETADRECDRKINSLATLLGGRHENYLAVHSVIVPDPRLQWVLALVARNNIP